MVIDELPEGNIAREVLLEALARGYLQSGSPLQARSLVERMAKRLADGRPNIWRDRLLVEIASPHSLCHIL
jgi:hypothetical protein